MERTERQSIGIVSGEWDLRDKWSLARYPSGTAGYRVLPCPSLDELESVTEDEPETDADSDGRTER